MCVPASFIFSYALRRASIEELSGRIDPYEMLPQAREKLRRALRDPTLQILLPASSGGLWIDAEGYEQPFPADAERLIVPVDDEKGNRVAAVSVHPSLARFGDLLTATVQSLVLVLGNARLLAQLRDELALIEQSYARIEEAVAAERKAIQHRSGAGPLHLAETARQHLDSAVTALTASGQPVPDSLIAARTTVAHATADIRRLSSGAEPLGLSNGLAEALPRVLAVHPTVHAEVADIRADPEVEPVAYFVVTAAVGNAIMHAGPASTVIVTVTGVSGGTPVSVFGASSPLVRADVLVRLCLLRIWGAGLLQGSSGRTPCRAALLYEVVLAGRGPERLHLGLGVCDRVCRDGESRSGYGLCFQEGAWGRADGG